MAVIGRVRRRVMVPYGPRKRRRLFGGKSRTSTFNRQGRRHVKGPLQRGTLRERVSSIARVVKTMVPEIKYSEEILDATNLQNTGAVVAVTAIGSGSGPSQRVGDAITVKSVQCYGIITRSSDISSADTYLRFVLFTDKEQVADGVPTIGTVFPDASEPWVPIPASTTQGRFRMLAMSKLYSAAQIVPTTTNIYGGAQSNLVPTQMPAVELKWSGEIKVIYNGDADTDIQKNGIFFGIMCSGNTNLDFNGLALISYIDS